MAGTIVADTLTHSTAGSLTTDYVVNGSAKAWVNFNGTGTIAARDSLNLSSLTDNTTGKYTVNLSNSMESGNYAFVAAVGRGSNGGARILGNELAEPTTTALRMSVWTTATVGVDPEILCVEFNGDLA